MNIVVRDGNTVTAVVSNRGASYFLENLVCSMRRLSMPDKFIIFALDNLTCPHLTSIGLVAPDPLLVKLSILSWRNKLVGWAPLERRIVR